MGNHGHAFLICYLSSQSWFQIEETFITFPEKHLFPSLGPSQNRSTIPTASPPTLKWVNSIQACLGRPTVAVSWLYQRAFLTCTLGTDRTGLNPNQRLPNCEKLGCLFKFTDPWFLNFKLG